MLFQKPWVAMRVDKNPMSGVASPLLYVITAVGALVSAITLDWIIGLAHASSLLGGAILVERLGFEPALATRDAVMTAEKERIAKAAVDELPRDGAIIIDAGTTTGRLAAELPLDRELTVVVNSPPLAVLLASRPNLTVIALGGRVRGRTLATVDDFALQLLSQVYVDVAFMATNGVSTERGLTTPDPAEAAVKRSMMAAARRTVLLADHTKVGNDYFARFGALTDVDVLISDAGLNESVAADLIQAGPRVVLA